MKFAVENTLNKLMLLFVIDKAEIPLSENTILDICTSKNSWIAYMDCMQALGELISANFIYSTTNRKRANLYTLTPEGRICLAHFYDKIPASIRAEMVEYLKLNRLAVKRKQEYSADYFQNPDGTYTVLMRINDHVQSVLEMRLNVENRAAAKSIYLKWEDMAAQVYAALNELLLE